MRWPFPNRVYTVSREASMRVVKELRKENKKGNYGVTEFSKEMRDCLLCDADCFSLTIQTGLELLDADAVLRESNTNH